MRLRDKRTMQVRFLRGLISEYFMPVEAWLINEPAIDFTVFLGVCHKGLGYSPASAADASHKKFSHTEKFLSCLAALRDERAPAGITANLLSHASFSVLLITEERDLVNILEAASGMPFVQAESIHRGVSIAVVTGTLAEWRDAVKSGLTPAVDPAVRAAFSKILVLFEKHGLATVWNDYTKRPAPDRSGFYLEDKRK